MTRPTKMLLDRLERVFTARSIPHKRSDLLEIAAAALGYFNSAELTAAARKGDITPKPGTALGTFDLPTGETLVVVEDNAANAPYAVDQTFIENVVDDVKGEAWGVTPYGNLIDLSNLAAKDSTMSSLGTAGAAAGYVISLTSAGEHDFELLWWNNTDGWGDLASATVFPDQGYNLPTVGIEPDLVRWEKLPGPPFQKVEPEKASLDIKFLSNSDGHISNIDLVPELLRKLVVEEHILVPSGIAGDNRKWSVMIGCVAELDGQIYMAPTIDLPVRILGGNAVRVAAAYRKAIEPVKRFRISDANERQPNAFRLYEWTRS